MNIYTINIVTTTKNKELYERVSVNEYPLVIKCLDRDRLKLILSEKKEYIKNNLKTETLYNHAQYYIREINLNKIQYNVDDFNWNVKDITIISY